MPSPTPRPDRLLTAPVRATRRLGTALAAGGPLARPLAQVRATAHGTATAAADLALAGLGVGADLALAVGERVTRTLDLLDSAHTLAGRAGDLMDRAGTLLERAETAVAGAETLLGQADTIVTGVSATARAAAEEVARVGAVSAAAAGLVERVADVAERADTVVARAGGLVEAVAPLARTALPHAQRFLDDLDPAEVSAVSRIVDRTPEVLEHLDNAVIPTMERMSEVGPDIRTLLETVQGLADLIGAMPGSGLLRRRAEREEHQQD